GSGGPALSEEVRAIAPDALPVHRLDRDTSGVVLFALTREAHRALNKAFESRRAEKTYLALVRGDLAKAQRIAASLREPRGGRGRPTPRPSSWPARRCTPPPCGSRIRGGGAGCGSSRRFPTTSRAASICSGPPAATPFETKITSSFQPPSTPSTPRRNRCLDP